MIQLWWGRAGQDAGGGVTRRYRTSINEREGEQKHKTHVQ